MDTNDQPKHKIAIDGREITNKGTGIGRYTKNLISNLLQIDKSIDYYVLTNGENLQLGEYTNLKILPSEKIRNSDWETKFVPEVMEKYKLDLFHNTRSGNTYFQPMDFPYITTVHDIIPWKFQKEFPQTVVNRWNQLFPQYIENAKHVITISNKTTEDLVAWTGINKERFSIIYQGIDRKFDKISKQKAKELMKTHFDLEHPYILTIGRNQTYKNVHSLIKAYSLLPKKLKKNFRLVIGGNRVEEYQSIINDLSLKEYVKPLGYIPEELLAALYSGSELYVFPSLYEGFGFPPLEAMSFGIPVLSSNMDTMHEVLEDAAIYFNPMDPADMADKIKLMLKKSSLCNEMSKKGLNHIKKYSWEKTARQTLQVYQSILNK